MTSITPSAGYTFTLRTRIRSIPGMLGRLTTAIGQAGGDIDAVDIVEHRGSEVVRDIAVKCRDEEHSAQVIAAVREIAGIELLEAIDRTFALHQGGKIAVSSKLPVRTRDDLSMAYTPGVGRVSQAIAAQPERVWELTIKRNAVAVLTDGSAVLGLGDIGPEAAMPVMEGKALLFKEFAGVDAYPICVRVESPEQLIEVGAAIAPGFGGINLEDVAAPACFTVEEELSRRLDIPVFHDDQHGTAIVVLAAMLNAARCSGRRLGKMKLVVLGLGASAVASTKLLLQAGVGDVITVDRAGVVYAGRTEHMNPQKQWIAEHTNRERVTGDLAEALRGADAFIGLSGPNLARGEWLAAMRPRAIAFALANPTPEIMPEEMPENVRIVATGRSDYPNQINNVLAFPGVFRGLLDCRARGVNDAMKIAAAEALAGLVAEDELSEEYIVPSVFNRQVVPAVAGAVQQAAAAAGLNRLPVG